MRSRLAGKWRKLEGVDGIPLVEEIYGFLKKDIDAKGSIERDND